MYCPKCGTLNQDDASYCMKCGNHLRSDTIFVPQVMPPALEYSNFWRRLGASFIDGLIIAIPVQIVLWSALLSIGFENMSRNISSMYIISSVINIVSLVGNWLYSALMTSSSRQATVGKMALGIIVTDLSGKRLTFARATARFFAIYISEYSLFIGFLMIIWTKRKQALHDMIAGTVVLRKR